MRTTLKQVPIYAREEDWRTALSAWWFEFPPRSWRLFWKPLLFEEGQGWLRWKKELRHTRGGYLEPPEPFFVAPPLHRLWMEIREFPWSVFMAIRGDVGWKGVIPPYGFLDQWKDPDRLRLLWR